MTEQESTGQGKSDKQINARIDLDTHLFLRDVFQHLNPEGEILSDYKFYSKLLEFLKLRISGDLGSGSTFGAIVNYVREVAQAQLSTLNHNSDNVFSGQASSLATDLDFEILSKCPHYQGHNEKVVFCKSRSKQLRTFRGKLPHSVCNVHWLRFQRSWEALSPEEKKDKQRQMQERKYQGRDNQPYYSGDW